MFILFHRHLVSVEIYCPSGWSVSVLLLDNLHGVSQSTNCLRNETVSGWKCLALRRRQLIIDCFVRIEVLCGFTVSLVRLFRFYRSIISRFAKYQLVLCETRRFPVGNALLGEGGSVSSIVSSVLRFCVALLSVWFACFGFIYRYHRVSQSTNWYFAKRDGFRSETLCLEKEAACRRLFRLQLGSVWLYCRSGSLVSVLFGVQTTTNFVVNPIYRWIRSTAAKSS